MTQPRLTTAHTADLDRPTLQAARALLAQVFDDFAEDDWEHALGGIHALVQEDGELIAHASVVQRRLLYEGRALRAGDVEAVGVRADRRGRGHGAAVMGEIERMVRGAYDLGALGSTDEARPFHARRGRQLWQGPSSALTPQGVQPTPDSDGCIYMLPQTVALDVSRELTCDWRGGDLW